MTDRGYQEALHLLSLGKVPMDLTEFRNYCTNGVYELIRGFAAAVECIDRLDATNKMLRKMAQSANEQNKILREEIARLKSRLEAVKDE